MSDPAIARAEETLDLVTTWRRANPGCCPRCGWHLSSHGHSHGYQSDCPNGASPSARDGSLRAMQRALRGEPPEPPRPWWACTGNPCTCPKPNDDPGLLAELDGVPGADAPRVELANIRRLVERHGVAPADGHGVIRSTIAMVEAALIARPPSP